MLTLLDPHNSFEANLDNRGACELPLPRWMIEIPFDCHHQTAFN